MKSVIHIQHRHWQTHDALENMDTVLRHVQDVEVTNRFGNMDAVLRRTQDASIHLQLFWERRGCPLLILSEQYANDASKQAQICKILNDLVI